MAVGDFVFLDGAYLTAPEARISPFDRGFLFADAVYEVTAVYDGKCFDMDGHLTRLKRSLGELAFDAPPALDQIAEMHAELIVRNNLTEGQIYLQVSRGAYGDRDFVAPASTVPTVFAFTQAKQLIDTAASRNGIRAITVDDIRWGRRDIKTTQLLAQTLAKQTAKQAGAQDAWMVEEGLVTEGASANAWIVTQDDVLVTRQISNSILSGITRASVISRLGNLHFEERAFTPDEAKAAKEAFSTSASALVMPVVQLDDTQIGDGTPGPVTRSIQRAYYEAMGANVQAVAPWALA
ncbi:MAG: hypothetical protein CME88_12340 [Hirschia sp.]|nr:hypothetical protein [Hirschia sp.]MBF19157.1 hypothetical protein [Hirschia sp.]